MPAKRTPQRRRQSPQQQKQRPTTSTAEIAAAATQNSPDKSTPQNPNSQPPSSFSNTSSDPKPHSNDDNLNEETAQEQEEEADKEDDEEEEDEGDEDEEEDSPDETASESRCDWSPDIQQQQKRQQESTVTPKRATVANPDDGGSRKKRKQSLDGEDLSPRKQNFERIWKDEDEIVVLEGLIEYMKSGSNPSSDVSGFFEFIKPSLHCNFNRNQVGEKVRRLRRKYLKDSESLKNGDGPPLLNPHKKMLYDLSESIWGSKKSTVENDFGAGPKHIGVSVAAGPSNVAAPAVGPTVVGEVRSGESHPDLNELLNFGRTLNATDWSESMLKRGLASIEKSKAEELIEKWRKSQMMKLEVHLNQVTLYRELGMLVMEVLKSS